MARLAGMQLFQFFFAGMALVIFNPARLCAQTSQVAIPPAELQQKLLAVPATDPSGIRLEWQLPASPTTIERWVVGGTPQLIATLANSETHFLDRTAKPNRIYSYQVGQGGRFSKPAMAVLSDLERSFVCPAIPPVSASRLGIDRSERFTNPQGRTVQFTIRAPLAKQSVIKVPPCGSLANCHDDINLQKALGSVIEAGGGTVQLEAGDYHFHPTAYANIAITNGHDITVTGVREADGRVQTHLYFNNVSATTLGAGIQISASDRVLIKDVTLDWDIVNAVPGIVRDAGPNAQKFYIQDPAYYIRDPANVPPAINLTGYNLATRTFTQVSGARLGITGTFNPDFARDHGYYYLIKGQKYFPDGASAISYVVTGPALQITHSSNTSLEWVEVYGGGGPGVIFGPGGRGLRLSNFKITRKPDSMLKPGEKPRLVALVGDSDANGSRGGILIENSEFGFIDDDTFYNRGFSAQVSAVTSTSSVEVVSEWAPAPHERTRDDVLMFTDPRTLAPISDVLPLAGPWKQEQFKSAAGQTLWKWSVPFSPAIPELAAYIGLPPERLPVISQPRYSGADFVMRNSCAHDNHGRVFLRMANALVENNIFANSHYGPIELSADPTWLNDGPSPNNIILRHNMIIGSGYGSTDNDWMGRSNGKRQTGWAAAAIYVYSIASTGFVPKAGYPIRFLQITDNFISQTPGLAIAILGARDVDVSGNMIANANTIPFEAAFQEKYCGTKSRGYEKFGSNQPWCLAKVAAQGSIMIARSSHVHVKDNVFLGTSLGIFVDAASTTQIER